MSDNAVDGRYQDFYVFTVVGDTLMLLEVPSYMWTRDTEASKHLMGNAIDSSARLTLCELERLAD